MASDPEVDSAELQALRSNKVLSNILSSQFDEKYGLSEELSAFFKADNPALGLRFTVKPEELPSDIEQRLGAWLDSLIIAMQDENAQIPNLPDYVEMTDLETLQNLSSALYMNYFENTAADREAAAQAVTYSDPLASTNLYKAPDGNVGTLIAGGLAALWGGKVRDNMNWQLGIEDTSSRQEIVRSASLEGPPVISATYAAKPMDLEELMAASAREISLPSENNPLARSLGTEDGPKPDDISYQNGGAYTPPLGIDI